MNTENATSLDWLLLLKWVLATAIGLFISEFLNFIFGPMLAILVGGLFIGILQWIFVLRSQLEKSQQWIWFTAIGWALSFLITTNINVTTVSLFIHGIVLGLSQWFFFMRKLNSTSFWWVLLNALGLPLTFLFSWQVIFPILLGGYDGPLSGPMDSIIRGILFGTITGFYIMWLISQSQKTTDALLPNIE